MKKNLKWVILTFFIIGIVFLFFLNNYSKSAKKETLKEEPEELIFKEEKEETNKKDEQKENVFVDIKGAIANPGVYELEQNKKVIDQTTPNMIQRLNDIVERKPLISIGI